MYSKKVLKNEKVSLKGVLASSPFDDDLLSFESLLGHVFIKKEKLNNEVSFAVIGFNSKVKASDRLISNGNAISPKTENGLYFYNVIIVEFKLKNYRKYLLLLAPNAILFKELLQSSKLSFNRIDISKICSDQFVSVQKNPILVKRLSARVINVSSKNITSLALFGENIVGKKEIFDLLGVDVLKASPEKLKDFNPFDSTKSKLIAQRRIIKPNSCRLKYETDDGNSSDISTSINLDIFGNFSTYFTGYESLKCLYEYFDYFCKIDSIVGNVLFDQLTRSKRSLEMIENGS